MSTTEHKALELADRLQQDFNSEYINWDNVVEASAVLRRLSADNEALRASVQDWFCVECNTVLPPGHVKGFNLSCDCGRCALRPSSVTERRLYSENHQLATMLATLDAELATLRARVDQERHQFKNFHQNLCKRFDYSHDEADWKRDQVSLIEWIAKREVELRAQVDALTRDTERRASKITELAAENTDREARHRADKARLQAIHEHQQGECWYWQGDGQDHLESLVGSLPVVIRADQLRELTKPQEPMALPEHETPEMHDAVMRVLYAGVARTQTDLLWQAYRSALPTPSPLTRPAVPEGWKLVPDETHRRFLVGPTPWTHTRVPQRLFDMARAVAGTSTAEDDKRVYNVLQATLQMLAAAPQSEMPKKVVHDVDAAAKALAKAMDYPWEHMPEQGRAQMRKDAEAILEAAAPQPEEQPTEARCGYCDGTGHVHDQIGEWRGLCICEAGQAIKAQPINLAVIRKWPEGFEARLQHVWKDVICFIPNVKLYDLQRVLAEFGFMMTVTEMQKGGA